MNPKIIFLPHANIQYSQLRPDRRAWVAIESYEKLFDLVASDDRYRIAFEASGETIDFMARETPGVIAKLRSLIREKKIEPVASPFTHLMISNIDPEICLITLKDGLDAWEKHTGVRPETGWNPECAWAGYVPDIYKAAGFKSLIMDADSFFLSFPEIREATGLTFDVAGHSNKNHLFRIEDYIKDKPEFLKYLTNPSKAKNGLNLIFRSDMMSNFMLWYLMGATEGYREKPVAISEVEAMLARWKDRVAATGGFILPYAEDAEYIGTTAYFYVKQFGQARFFEPEPGSIARFKDALDAAVRLGYDLATPADVLKMRSLGRNDFIENIENGVAWHGGTAKAWANTKYARILDPVCRSVYDGIKSVCAYCKIRIDAEEADVKIALKRVISAYVSDSRWPPDPTSPGRFNVEESLADLDAANEAIAQLMKKHGVEGKRSLYSPTLMKTQIERIRGELMALPYFGENAAGK
ncbi:MAG: glycoside hydrolase family 57 [Spirochaetes bacterium]|nr:glycoside hydrolase family 57 [Spirochaetota bacterium]